MSKLVVVESPAKAKTIQGFLGSQYRVVASVGHIRDLPESASEIPEQYKKEKWSRIGVNVEKDFEPIYVVPDDKAKNVKILRDAAKGITELILATDEDREGEAISWHILEVLNPKKGVEVQRVVFHELTPEAIKEGFRTPRKLDENLVKAQETRRILDRLYGYTLSPLLWKKVAPKLSAGRVQSVAVRLCVERERARMRFTRTEFWDLEAQLQAKNGQLEMKLISIEGDRLATGKSFDPDSGTKTDKSYWLKADEAGDIAERLQTAKPWTVAAIDAKPGQENPPKPFTTSTLQQESARKLHFTGKRTMQIAQGLYEGIDLKGERVGLITYMRTDSLNLAERALEQAREVIGDLYGKDYLPPKAVRYKTNSKGAQEAHEAIRPTDLRRRPQDVKPYLTAEQFKLYELIWKRTIACQMVPARVTRTTVTAEVKDSGRTYAFTTSGKAIDFHGFLRAYVEGSDDPMSDLGSSEKILPIVKVGETLDLLKLEAEQHFTMPPARYTEPSLIKKLEEEGIGRPSTYVSILSTIQDRGYIFKRGNELIPTFTAFAVISLLEDHFNELVDLKFTAKMEEELDDVADGEMDAVSYLKKFYRGAGSRQGLAKQVEEKADSIPYPSIPIGVDDPSLKPVVVRIGRFGPFLQSTNEQESARASLPPDTVPSELNYERAQELLQGKTSEDEPIAVEPSSGHPIFLRKGRFGAYLEVPEQVMADGKPKRVSLPPDLAKSPVEPDDAIALLKFPLKIGKREDGSPIEAFLGRYGPFIKSGDEIRNIETWRIALELTEEEAEAILNTPKSFRRGGATSTPSKALKEFGKLEGAEGNVRVLDGRYGPYVTDGKTNATLPKSMEPTELTAEEAVQLLQAKAAAGPSKKGSKAKTGRTSRAGNKKKPSKR